MSKKRRKRKTRIKWSRVIISLFVVVALGFGIYKGISTLLDFFVGNEVIIINNDGKDDGDKNEEKIVEVVDPVATVIIDPGHGGMDAGTKRGTYYEKDIVLKASKIVQEELQKQNIKVVLTRESDEALDPKSKVNDLKKRANFSKEYQADYFVSIHVNAYEKSNNISGFEVYVKNDKSKSIASAIGKQIESLNLSKNRGIYDGKTLQVLRDNTVPSVLIELGYINGKDFEYLSNDDRINDLSKAISKGILETIK